MLKVSMLGRMSISVGERRVMLALAPRERLLASYLFEFSGRVHRREHLTDLFWPERSAAQGRAAMNTALWRMRKVLALDDHAAALLSSTTEISFEPDANIEIDTHGFDAAVRNALSRNNVGRSIERFGALEHATDRYGGKFLDGDDEEDWVVAERERLHSLYVRCLSELMRVCAVGSNFESAICAARKILAVDPFREVIMRSLAILLFLNGQRPKAIQELERWQKSLDKEVGVCVMPETRELLGSLRSGSLCADINRWRNTHLVPPTEN